MEEESSKLKMLYWVPPMGNFSFVALNFSNSQVSLKWHIISKDLFFSQSS